MMTLDALPPLLTYDDAKSFGISRHRLDQLILLDEFERIAPGVFLRKGVADDTTAAWMAIARKNPDATLCLLTALSLHELTDEIPTQSDIAIPRGTQPVAVRYAPISWHQFDRTTFHLGRTKHNLPGGLSIGLYSEERTLIDIFRLRHLWGNDLAIGALKSWLRRRGSSPGTLLKLAKHFPKATPALHRALEVLT
jgi:predicted transcriptional regulator of viral defense system